MNRTNLKKQAVIEIKKIKNEFQKNMTKWESSDKKKDEPKDKLNNVYILGYEKKINLDKFENDKEVLHFKEVSESWNLNYFDEMMIKTVLENSNLGFPKKHLVFSDKKRKFLDVDKTLSKLEDLGYIFVFNNPKKNKEEAIKKENNQKK